MTTPPSPDAAVANASEQAQRWRFGNAVFDEATFELTVGDDKRELARKPLELLMFLLRNPGEVVTKDELFEAVWPGRIVTEGSLTNAIGRLRTALGDENQELIKVVYGYGYRFTAEPTRDLTVLPKAELPSVVNFNDGDPVPLREGWHLRRRLGAGGSGEAWLAEHAETGDTRVFKFARDRQALVALKREVTLSRLMRDALGERQDLARVIDWNLDPPFFIAIEHCNEGSLIDWSARQGGIRQVPLAQRLELIAQAADALAGAHQVGVLHKDLKPSNLLLHKDREGMLILKLADFGSARLIDRERLVALDITRLGFTQTLAEPSSGTPLYLAPELQAGHPSTTRSDVYALGVMLYQVIVGDLRRALAPGWERNIDDELLREDIALSADGDVANRLDSAAELAQRLRSLSERRQARAAALEAAQEADRLRESLRGAEQRRGFLRVLAGVLAVGLIATAVGFWQARIAQRQAESALAEAGAVSAFLRDDLLAAADPYRTSGSTPSVRDLVDRASATLDQRFGAQPQVRAAIGFALARTYQGIGEWPQAEARAQAAWKDVDDGRRPLSALARDILELRAELALAPSRMDEAKALFEQLRDERARSLGAEHPDTLRAEARLGWLTFRLGHYEDALKQFESVRARAEHSVPADPLLLPELDLDMGSIEQELNRNEAAATRLRAALPLYAEHAPGDPRTTLLWRQSGLSSILITSGHLAEAEVLIQSSLEGLTAKLGADHPYVGMTLNDLGWLRLLQGHAAESVALQRKALATIAKTQGEEHAWVRLVRNQLAEALLADGVPADRTEALTESRRAYEGCRSAQGAEHPHCLSFASGYADALTANGDFADSARVLDENLEIAARMLPPANWRTAWLWFAKAHLGVAQGDAAGARAAYQQAAGTWRAFYGERSVQWQQFVAEAQRAGVELAAH